MHNLQLHLLLADDDSDDCYFFFEALRETHIIVDLSIVKDGVELMQWLLKIGNCLPDLLFLDLNMPRKNGHECLREIKQHPALKSLPVIILSTASNPPEIESLYKQGAQYYIQKPTGFSQLVHVIEDVLNLDEKKQRVQPTKENFIFQHY